jgi:hypothetical protein
VTGLAFSLDSSIDNFIQFLGGGEGFLQREDCPVINFYNTIINCKRKDENKNVYRFETFSDKNNKSNWVIDSARRGSDKGYDYLNYLEFKQMMEIIKIIDPISYRKFEEYINSINNENSNTLGDNLEALMSDNNVKGPKIFYKDNKMILKDDFCELGIENVCAYSGKDLSDDLIQRCFNLDNVFYKQEFQWNMYGIDKIINTLKCVSCLLIKKKEIL